MFLTSIIALIEDECNMFICTSFGTLDGSVLFSGLHV